MDCDQKYINNLKISNDNKRKGMSEASEKDIRDGKFEKADEKEMNKFFN